MNIDLEDFVRGHLHDCGKEHSVELAKKVARAILDDLVDCLPWEARPALHKYKSELSSPSVENPIKDSSLSCPSSRYTEKNGGPAFPFATYPSGMTLRDWFAGQSLDGIASIPSDDSLETNVRLAYAYADKMLREREK